MPLGPFPLLTATATSFPPQSPYTPSPTVATPTAVGTVFTVQVQGLLTYQLLTTPQGSADVVRGWSPYIFQQVNLVTGNWSAFKPTVSYSVNVGLPTATWSTNPITVSFAVIIKGKLCTASFASFNGVFQVGVTAKPILITGTAKTFVPKYGSGITAISGAILGNGSTFSPTYSILTIIPVRTVTGSWRTWVVSPFISTKVPVGLSTGTATTFVPSVKLGAGIVAGRLIGNWTAPVASGSTGRSISAGLPAGTWKAFTPIYRTGNTVNISFVLSASGATYPVAASTGQLYHARLLVGSASTNPIHGSSGVTAMVRAPSGQWAFVKASPSAGVVFAVPGVFAASSGSYIVSVQVGTQGSFVPLLGTQYYLVPRQEHIFVHRCDIYRQVKKPDTLEIYYYPYIVGLPCFMHTALSLSRPVEQAGMIVKEDREFTTNRLNIPAQADVRSTDRFFVTINPYPNTQGPNDMDTGTWWAVRSIDRIRMQTIGRRSNKGLVFVDPDGTPPLCIYDPVSGSVTPIPVVIPGGTTPVVEGMPYEPVGVAGGRWV